jgi:type VI secretion system protein ImpJ
MSNLPVHWHEGMFLRPQHFQAADRHWADALRQSEYWDHEYNYGLREVEISSEAIANYHVQLTRCQCRMRDGTQVSLEPGNEPDRVELKPALEETEAMFLKVDLKEAFERDPVVRVFLAVPKLKLGSANVAIPGNGAAGTNRFVPEPRELADESSGGNDQPIQLRKLNARLLLSTQDTSGYELLPIAQIKRAGEGEALPVLDDQYFPPLLAVDCWPPLGRDVVRAIYDLIGQRIEIRSEQIINRGVSMVSHDVRDLERLFMLKELNAAYTTLSVLAFARGVHPFLAYTELCRIVGQLSIFGKARRPPDVPRYDHDDLARIFYYIKQQIEMLLDTIPDYEFEQRPFIGEGLGMQVRLESPWLRNDWDWYVGVSRGSLSEADLRGLLAKLDWKLGSSRNVDLLFTQKRPGLMLTPLEQAPRALPANRDWSYFVIARNGAAWTDVHQTQTLAMRLKESLILNRNELQGERTLRVMSEQNRAAELQFSLFAVPQRQ